MSEIAVVVKVTAAEGKRDEALAVLGRLVEAAAGEPGTLEYVVMADSSDPNTILTYELYADQAALDAHASSPTMAEVGQALGGLLDGSSDVRQARVVHSKGLPA
jgi:quinol monooxygenase YgiN